MLDMPAEVLQDLVEFRSMLLRQQQGRLVQRACFRTSPLSNEAPAKIGNPLARSVTLLVLETDVICDDRRHLPTILCLHTGMQIM